MKNNKKCKSTVPIKIKNLVKKILGLPDGTIKVPMPRSGRGKPKVRNPTEEEKEFREESRESGKPVQPFINELAAIMDKDKIQEVLPAYCSVCVPGSS